MTMTDLADLILTRMHDLAQTQGYAEQFDVRAIAREFGEHEYMKVFNASKVLEGKGWILADYDVGEGIHAFLTGPGSIAVDQGGTTGIIHAFRQDPRRFLVVDRSTHYHGPISGQNLAINSQVGSQSSTFSSVPREVVDMLGRISDQLRRSAELDEAHRHELLNDVQTLLSELQRATPRAGIVRDILSTLANVATIHPWAIQLLSHPWVTQVLSSLPT
jgi:hypothetical protein